MQFEKLGTNKIVALTAIATLAALTLTYEVQGCAVDQPNPKADGDQPARTTDQNAPEGPH